MPAMAFTPVPIRRQNDRGRGPLPHKMLAVAERGTSGRLHQADSADAEGQELPWKSSRPMSMRCNSPRPRMNARRLLAVSAW